MQTLGKSRLGKTYDCRPPHAGHPMLASAQRLQGAPNGPDVSDWRHLLRPVRDQGHEGDCFAFAAAALKEFNCAMWGGGRTPLGGDLSPAYLAWRTRLAEGTFPDDAGASLADAMAVLRAFGVCPETFLPYRQDATEAGDATCDVAALPYRVGTPCTVSLDERQFRTVLGAGHVIAVGFAVHQSFEETGADGMVPPVQSGEPLLGGHAVLVCGFGPQGFIVRNSWSSNWGDGGYFYWQPDYLAQCWEAWTTG